MARKTIQEKQILQKALLLAEKWQNDAQEFKSPFFKKYQARLDCLFKNPGEKFLFMDLLDQGFRSKSKTRARQQLMYLLEKHGVPNFFLGWEKIAVKFFWALPGLLQVIIFPLVIKKIRRETRHVIIPGEANQLRKHLRLRKKENIRQNINFLGEAVLGEEEAKKWLDEYLNLLKNPMVEFVSVKVSSIFSQHIPLAKEESLKILKRRLSILFDVAKENEITSSRGGPVSKFINLDMEEYKNLHLTVDAFLGTLDKKEFQDVYAGIALQSYIPDSLAIQKRITAWAKKRISSGGSPIKVRLVKGANLEMESFDSNVHNWPLPIYPSKKEVDQNFKLMLEFALADENIKAVRLGIASHNIFDLALAFTLARENGLTDYITIEMLEGMADHYSKAIKKSHPDILLYAPVVRKKNFINALAYLIRRLDENTSPENFLRYSMELTPGSKTWKIQMDKFVEAYKSRSQVSRKPFRNQDRNKKTVNIFYQGTNDKFINETDTDWSLEVNRHWAKEIRQEWKKTPYDIAIEIPLVINNRKIIKNRKLIDIIDKSQLPENVIVAKYALGEESDLPRLIKTARKDPDKWRSLKLDKRLSIVKKAAGELRLARGDLIGAACANTGKVFTEADVEVSEAIDFAEFYPHSVKKLSGLPGISFQGKGVGLVIPPWNFPIAIPAGGVLAALASGNTVILKPSSDAVLVAFLLCQCFWRAGISKNTLQFFPCQGNTTAKKLIHEGDIDFVIFTGGTDTALGILENRPDIIIAAETGGKNATIVTAMADRDLAIRNVLHSAFSNSGQKCSATSLLILEEEVFESNDFKKQLKDAVRSISTGSAWEFRNKVGPLIHPPKDKLKKSFNESQDAQIWLVEPERAKDNPYIWKPAVKWNVKKGSFCHMTELFGPMLSVMKAKNLEHAIEIANATGYGLTSGLESLDKREWQIWQDRIHAGNLYINRGTTGAIVLRQPFGGINKSAIGRGIKAGGYNYAVQFVNFTENGNPSSGKINGNYPILDFVERWYKSFDKGKFSDFRNDFRKVHKAVISYLFNFEREFSQKKDYFNIPGQDNYVRYIPAGSICIRVHDKDSLFDILARVCASKIAGCKTILSLPPTWKGRVYEFLINDAGIEWLTGCDVKIQTDKELSEFMPSIARIRYAHSGRVSPEVLEAAAPLGFYVSRTPPLTEGRLELLNYFYEQSICVNYHRYGNLGERNLKS